MGGAAFRAGHLDEAESYLTRALAIEPSNPGLLSNYALILLVAHKNEQAIAPLRAVIQAKPQEALAHYLLGNALKDHGFAARQPGLIEEALMHYQIATSINPAYGSAFNNWGVALLDLGRVPAAEICFRKAIALLPDDPQPINNLAITTRLLGHAAESAALCRQAIVRRPGYHEALNNLANALKDMGDLQGAADAYAEACKLVPENSSYQCNLALALLGLGQYAEGWAAYESRKKTPELAFAQPRFSQPAWQGQANPGKTLLIYAEQGFGDTLQFCRYATKAAQEKGLHVWLNVPPALARLVRTLPGIDGVVTDGEPLPAFDYHCAMLSLPFAFKTGVKDIPNPGPYLFASDEDQARWRARLADEKITGLKVGLVWSGLPRKQSADLTYTDKTRSMTAEAFRPLIDVPNIHFFSLQKIGEKPPADFPVSDWMNDCTDFADTAGLVMNLDLVITVDTSVAHLAGALGKPVWVLNRFNGCWRWFKDREDSPWYDTVRLFNQTSYGNWDDVITRVRLALEEQTQNV